MYLRSFIVIQILAFLTAQIWAYVRLRTFGQAFMTKLQTLTTCGYIPIPLPHEMSDYLSVGSLAKAGSFFTFTIGFTLGIVAFGGSFCLNRYRFPRPIRLGWTVFISALFAFLLGFPPVGLLLLVAFFGLAHLSVRVPDAPFHKFAFFSLIPLILIPVIYQSQDILLVRDYLLQNPWGRKVVTFYYRYSPLSAELITPPTERAQVTVWSGSPMGEAQRSWLLRRGIYTVSTRRGADLVLPGEAKAGPAVLKAIRKATAGRDTKRLGKTIKYSIYFGAPLAIMLLVLVITDRLLTISTRFRIVLLVCVGLSALLICRPLFQMAWKPTGKPPNEELEEVRHWALWAKKTGDRQARDTYLRLLDSTNPAVRLRAATALADLPSKHNIEILKKMAGQDPITIVRCKAIFALSHQGDRRMVPFLESRLKGREDWYVKHYLLRALRRFGWIG